jgi:tetratricopeptide (TPR) repeat protein
LFNAALTKESPSKHGSRYISYMGMANIYIAYKNDHLSAIPLIEKALAERPEVLTPRKKLVISLINGGFYKEATEHIEILLEKRGLDYKLKDNEKISRSYLLNLKALVALKEDSLPLAQSSAKEAIILDPDDPFALANWGAVLSRMANYKQATHYLTKLQKLQGNPNLLTSFLLLENHLRASDMSQANELGLLILTSFPLNEVFPTLSLLEKPNMAQPVDHKLLRSFLTDTVNGLGALENFDVHPSQNIL